MSGVTVDLTGRTALVCGASAGIGRATALCLAASGASIIALARRADRLEALLPELEAAGAPSARALVADLDDTDGLRAAVTGLDAQILINNTGGPPAGKLTEASPEALAVAFRRHVIGGQTLLQALLPAMQASGYGRIINVLSTSVREPIPNLGVSNTIRGAMASWAKSLSKELGPGITINNVLLGHGHGAPHEPEGRRSGPDGTDRRPSHGGMDRPCTRGSPGPSGRAGPGHYLPCLSSRRLHPRTEPGRRWWPSEHDLRRSHAVRHLLLHLSDPRRWCHTG